MWIWLGSILVLLLLVLTLILLSKITFHIKLKKENKDETIMIDVTLLFGLLTYHYRIPALGLNKLQDGLWVENNSSDNFFKTHTSAGEQEIDKEKVNLWAEQFRDMIRATRGLKKWLNTTLRRVTLVSMEWSTNVALTDAAHTATLTGALWALKTTLIGWLSYHISLRQRPKLFVVPVFGGSPLFSTELNCTAEIRLGNAVYAGMVLVVRVLKVKGGVKKWRSLLSKGNQSGE
ncbi:MULTISPECIES: DUF2953 domain-containing protein [Paenibacillus]|uniref:DUF2953 domain-containing protein n=1 Tax=Paenibacillus vini TaxID=1476024 RepID=A0ABQ4M7V1_9BACL|nr:DUF2953 domain-containing protein [Paenibacillus vini]GIP52061.1 hypothetical protein J42TS3_10960 [Paenibacillus vini]